MQDHTHLRPRGKNYWSVVGMFCHMCPPYSPDLAPSYYHLFRSLQNSLNGITFTNDDDVKSHLVKFFVDKDQKFYEQGIIKLPEKWQKIIDNNDNILNKVISLYKKIGCSFLLKKRNYFLANSI